MTKDDITRNPYISCVEAYYLAWLSDSFDVRKLYIGSFTDIDEVIKDFASGANFADYGKIPRVQDMGEKLGVTVHKRKKLFGIVKNGLTLIKVNRKFFCGSLVPWREDHFIAVVRNEKREYEYINHYPLSCGSLSLKEITEVYDGVTLSYKFDGGFDEDKYSRLKEQTLAQIKEKSQQVELSRLHGAELRDAVGILRVSRLRTYLWLLSENRDLPELQSEVNALQRLYFKISTDLQRGNTNADYSSAWKNIMLGENSWRQKL